jgi:hypothetical protein
MKNNINFFIFGFINAVIYYLLYPYLALFRALLDYRGVPIILLCAICILLIVLYSVANIILLYKTTPQSTRGYLKYIYQFSGVTVGVIITLGILLLISNRFWYGHYPYSILISIPYQFDEINGLKFMFVLYGYVFTCSILTVSLKKLKYKN